VTEGTAANLVEQVIAPLDPKRGWVDENGKLNKAGWWLVRWLAPYQREDVEEAINQEKNSARFPCWTGARKYLKPPPVSDDKDRGAESWKHLKLGGLFKDGEVVMYGDEYARVYLRSQPDKIDFVRLIRYEEAVGAHVYFDFPIEDRAMMDRLRPLPEDENAQEIIAAWDRMQEKKELVGYGTAIKRMFEPLLKKMGVSNRDESKKRKALRRQRAQEGIEERRLREGKLPHSPSINQAVADRIQANAGNQPEASPFAEEGDW